MVAGLLDSSVMIDVLRDYEPARLWLAGQGQLGVTRIVWLELLEGAANRRAQQRALALLRRFEIVEMTTDDMQWAVEQMVRWGLSHRVDAFDCLIAAVCPRLALPLYTRNLRHFVPLIGDLAQTPY